MGNERAYLNWYEEEGSEYAVLCESEEQGKRCLIEKKGLKKHEFLILISALMKHFQESLILRR